MKRHCLMDNSRRKPIAIIHSDEAEFDSVTKSFRGIIGLQSSWNGPLDKWINSILLIEKEGDFFSISEGDIKEIWRR